MCSIGTYTNRHSTCTCTLQVSLRDSVAPSSTSVRLSKSRSSCIRGSACSHGTPWSQHRVMSHSLLALRHQIRYSFSVTPVGDLGRRPRSSTWWTRGVCSECVPVSRRPSSELGTRRAFHKSPPNEFDNHAPSRGPLRSSVTMCSMLARPRPTSRYRKTIMLDLRWSGHRLSHRNLKFLI